MNDKAIISIDLNITRFTKDMYENLINTISETQDNIEIYLYNYIAKKHFFIQESKNLHIFNYNGSKKKVALDIFQSLNTLSECLKNGFNKVYLLCGAIDRDILINVLQNLNIKVILLVQENSSTSLCEQLFIDRILPNPNDISTVKSKLEIKNFNNESNSTVYNDYNNDCGNINTVNKNAFYKNIDDKKELNKNAKKEFLFNTGIKANNNPKMIDTENKLRILLEALTKSKSDSLKKEYEKLLLND